MDVRRVWDRLQSIWLLIFDAQSRGPTITGWTGTGRGTVEVELVDAATILFHERGTWTPEGGRGTKFTNVFRWTVDPDGRFIRLEHLRFGAEQPVYLFDLVPASEQILVSSEPHVCREDLYAARLEYDAEIVHLTWTITGPKKDERIAYWYR